MNNIIVGIDFSECSLNALRHAAQIAEKSGCELIMVWVNRVANDNDIIKNDQALIEYGAKQRFSSLVAQYEPCIGEGKVKYLIRNGRVYEEMMNVCKEYNPMLLIIGSHGVSGFQERFIGSNAFRMALLLDIPTIIIREGINISHTIENVVMPIDTTIETRQKMPLTVEIAKYFGATIHVVGVHMSDNENSRQVVNGYINQVVKFIESNGVKYIIDEVHNNNEADGVIEYAKKVNANLISIMDEQERKAVNIFTGSFAQQIVNNSPYPVLICHAQDLYFHRS